MHAHPNLASHPGFSLGTRLQASSLHMPSIHLLDITIDCSKHDTLIVISPWSSVPSADVMQTILFAMSLSIVVGNVHAPIMATVAVFFCRD